MNSEDYENRKNCVTSTTTTNTRLYRHTRHTRQSLPNSLEELEYVTQTVVTSDIHISVPRLLVDYVKEILQSRPYGERLSFSRWIYHQCLGLVRDYVKANGHEESIDQVDKVPITSVDSEEFVKCNWCSEEGVHEVIHEKGYVVMVCDRHLEECKAHPLWTVVE